MLQYQEVPKDVVRLSRQSGGSWSAHTTQSLNAGHDPRQPFAIKQCKHGLMAYNRNDTYIGSSLDHYGEWCEFEIELMGKVLAYHDVVIDVGANIGTHAVAFSEIVGKFGRVYAFEPQPRLYRLLATNVALNSLGNVMTTMAALGSSSCMVAIADLPPDEVVCNFGALPLLNSAMNGSHAKMMTIDELGLEPALIKVDVEGMEADVLRGARETIRRQQPLLYLENNGEDSAAIAPILEEIGYRAWWSIGPYFNPANHFGNPVNIWESNVMPSANLVAAPKGSAWRFDLPEFQGVADNWMRASTERKPT